MADWWDEYTEERDPQQDAATEANAVAAQAQQDDPYAAFFNASPQPDEPAAANELALDTAPPPPAAVATALDNRGFVGNAINSLFDGAGKIVGGYLDKKFGTSEEYAAKQADLQRRLAGPDAPAAMYAPMDKSKGGFGVMDAAALALGRPPLNFIAGLPRRAFDAMGLDVQDMTPYGFAVMDRDEAAARATSGLPEPSDSSSDDNYIPLGGTPPAAPIGPQSGYAPGMGGASRSVKFRGYPDFTKPNPYG